VDGTLHLAGTAAAPLATAHVGLDAGLPGAAAAQRLAVALDASWQADRLTLRGTAGGLAATPLVLEAAVPLVYRADPPVIDLPPDGALSGHLTGPIDIGRARLTAVQDIDAGGVGQVSLTLGGTIATPAVSGSVTLTNGRLVLPQAGVTVANIDLALHGDGSGLRIDRLTATDGAAGHLAVTGTVDFGAHGQPVNLDATATGFAVHRDDVSGTLDAAISLAGPLAAPRIAGTVTVDEAVAFVPDRLPADLVKLPVTMVNAPAISGRKPPPTPATPLALPLALAIEIPGRVFVRGRGLESEWRGHLDVGGTTAGPDMRGTLTLVRGQFDFVGQNLSLTKGALTLPGGTSDPWIDLTASATTTSLQATLNLAGPASKPALTITSTPPLPSDEVLAQLLFNRRLDQLSATEAIELANGIRTLTGSGGAGLIDRLREVTGLDVIRFGGGGDSTNALGTAAGTAPSIGGIGGPGSITSTNSATNTTAGGALTVGKYINRRTFVSVDQGLTQDSGRVKVQVEVAPHISVDTSIGASSQGSVGLTYQRNY
jgi:translocation and assembly module TamB